MKTCTKCHKNKPDSEFGKKRATCKECLNKEWHEWYAKNKEKKAKQNREWNAKNKERRKQAGRKWRENNSDKVKQIVKKRVKNKTEKRIKRQTEERQAIIKEKNLHQHPFYTDYYCEPNGQIWSTKGNMKKIGKHESTNGYLFFIMSVDGKTKIYQQHKFVIECRDNKVYETGRKTDDLQVNHKNFDKHDNSFDNLELITCLENKNHLWLGRIDKIKGYVYAKRDNRYIVIIKNKYFGSYRNENDAVNKVNEIKEYVKENGDLPTTTIF